MFPMQRKVLKEKPVTVEYDAGKHRRRKVCSNSFEARSFYAMKFKQGKNPTIINEDKETT